MALSTPKNNILLPLNRFRTTYQNPLQQCTPYHTLYTSPSNILYFLSNYLFPSTTTRPIFVLQQQRGQELPGTEGDGERDERRRERQWRALGLWRATGRPPNVQGRISGTAGAGTGSSHPLYLGYRVGSSAPLCTATAYPPSCTFFPSVQPAQSSLSLPGGPSS